MDLLEIAMGVELLKSLRSIQEVCVAHECPLCPCFDKGCLIKFPMEEQTIKDIVERLAAMNS